MMASILTHLELLRRHGQWADERLLASLRAARLPIPAALRELAHIRGAQETWLARIEQRPATLPVWPEIDVDQLAAEGARLDASYAALFRELSPSSLERTIAYVNLAGVPFETSLVDMLWQVVTHGHYHRGKANAALRAANVDPAGVDYITWTRTQRDAGEGAP